MKETPPLYAVILAGGIGSRFWPLSTPERPKQLLPLIGDRSLLEDAVARLVPLVGPGRILILTSASLAPAIRRLIPTIAADQVLEEPRPIGTAGALAWASVEVQRRGGPDATLVSVHADWAIGDDAAFRETLAKAVAAATSTRGLATVGIVPTDANTGLGYIERGAAAGDGVHAVARFLEKPDRPHAEALVQSGALWNSGIFAWRAADYLAEVAAHTPELSAALATVTPTSSASAFFAAVTKPVSVDVGVLERSQRVVVLPGAFGWDDVGTWGSLLRNRAHDASGNAAHGRTYLVDARHNVVHSDGKKTQVVLYGVQDLVVVVRDGMTLVTTVERSSDLKTMLDALPRAVVESV